MGGGGGGGGAVPQEQLWLMNSQRLLVDKQLEQINYLEPFQVELLNAQRDELRQVGRDFTAMNAAITPEMRAAQAKQEMERSQRLGTTLDQGLQFTIDQLRQGGRATPEQLASIREATTRGIEAGSGDIDVSTQRGIGLIADELANARGLRLTDTPILREATLLARSGQDQKAGLIRNLRASEASAALNYPLAVQQQQSAINLGQQNVIQNAKQFQEQLQQQAYQNRLALTGQTAQNWLGLSAIGGNVGGAGSVNRSGGGGGSNWAQNLGGIGALASGLGAAWTAFSDRQLKKDYGVVGETRSGVPLHFFKYKGERDIDPLRLGVMAQEVANVRPEAVKRHSSGYLVVDYAGIGL